MPGKVTGLVGPDGAGKTTLLRLMAGLMHVTSGTIKIMDLDPIRDTSELRKIIGYMPQKFGLYDDLSVQENLNLHADLRDVIEHEREEEFQHLLKLTDLTAVSYTHLDVYKRQIGMFLHLKVLTPICGAHRP